MKKILSVLVALVLALGVNAAHRGKFIHVDASVNKNLKPQIAFCQDRKDGQNVTTLLVKTVNTNAYNEFTDASRVLLKFSDEKNIRLNRANAVVDKKKHSEKKGNQTMTFYETYTEYEVSPEVISKLEAGLSIVKVRIVFKENENKDYDLPEGYQPKFSADLLKSYQEADDKCKKANNDLSDEDF